MANNKPYSPETAALNIPVKLDFTIESFLNLLTVQQIRLLNGATALRIMDLDAELREQNKVALKFRALAKRFDRRFGKETINRVLKHGDWEGTEKQYLAWLKAEGLERNRSPDSFGEARTDIYQWTPKDNAWSYSCQKVPFSIVIVAEQYEPEREIYICLEYRQAESFHQPVDVDLLWQGVGV